MDTLTSYYGGKSMRLGKWIVEHIPNHNIYCELYGGMAGVLMQKPPSEIEIYNDLADAVVNLFKVARNNPAALEAKLRLTPYARAEWYACLESVNSPAYQELDEVERARQAYVVLDQSFNGSLKNNGWSFGGKKHDGNVANQFYNGLDNIATISKRLRNVLIECEDALKLIDRWDTPDTLFYLDPPYVFSTRGRGNKGKTYYQYEMQDDQHKQLIDKLLKVEGKVLLSGYDSGLYNVSLITSGWKQETFAARASSMLYSVGNGQKQNAGSEAQARVECLWINPAAQGRTLWSMSEVAVNG